MSHTDTVIDGKKCPSVTQVTNMLDKPFLYRWYGTHGFEKCEQMKEESAIAGRKFHADIEMSLKGHFQTEDFPVNPDNDEFIEAVIRWCDVTGFSPIAYEEYGQCKEDRFGGTFDCVGLMPDDVLTIVDWKKTGQISNTHPLQASGYWKIYKEVHGKDIQEARIVRPYELLKPAKTDAIKQTANGFKYSFKGLKVYIEERRFTGLEHYYDVFLNLRKTWDYLNDQGMWEK